MELLDYTNLYKLDNTFKFCTDKKKDKLYDLKFLKDYYHNYLQDNENILFIKENNILLYQIKKNIFKVKKTNIPDTYEIDDQSKYLCIININMSKKLNKLFENINEKDILCEFYEKHKKWIPII